MRTPSTKMLIVLAILLFFGASILMPFWYPGPHPVLAPDGSVVHGPDGKVLVHRDMTEFNRQVALPLTMFFCSIGCLVWLSVRMIQTSYWWLKARRARKIFGQLHPEIARARQERI